MKTLCILGGGLFLLIMLVVYFLFVHEKRALLKRMSAGVSMVKFGLYVRLKRTYQAEYGSERAGFLAAAVVNQMFSEQPGNDEARAFQSAHASIIEQAIRQLRSDSQICEAVTQAVRVKCTTAYAQGCVDMDSISAPLAKLMEYGVLVPGDDAPNPQTFIPLAQSFHDSSYPVARATEANPPQ